MPHPGVRPRPRPPCVVTYQDIARPIPNVKLVAKSGTLSVEIPPGRTLIVGRTEDCDLPLADPTVSRRHAELDLTDSGLRLRDVGSTNGTFVDGRRVSEAGAPPRAQVSVG